MPNWCINHFNVTGDKDRIKAFDQAFKGKGTKWGPNEIETLGKTVLQIEKINQGYEKYYLKKEPTYCFDALYPVPKEVIEAGYSNPSKSFGENFHELFEKEKWKDGYSWCISHWGTKWDINDVAVSDNIDEEAQYDFDTAWSPPIAWVEKVAKDWPDLNFELLYEEPGMQFTGRVYFSNGELQEDDNVGEDGYRQFVIDHFHYDPYDESYSPEEDNQEDVKENDKEVGNISR